jgi:hypothetical protein
MYIGESNHDWNTYANVEYLNNYDKLEVFAIQDVSIINLRKFGSDLVVSDNQLLKKLQRNDEAPLFQS